jgi:fumarate hydratase subunit alpha
MTITIDNIRTATSEALVKGSSTFSPDKIRAYDRAIKKETDEKARWVLEKLKENALISGNTLGPLCDDTGTPHPFLEIGKDSKIEGSIQEVLKAVEDGIRDGLRKLPGRPMGVKGEGLERVSQEKGLYEDSGMMLPAPTQVRVIDGNEVKINVLMQGGGPELRGKTFHAFHKHTQMQVIDTAIGWALEMVQKLGCTPCVPSIGIGRTHFEASSMMIEAMRNGNFDEQSEIEKYVTDKINTSNVGPLGLGGSVTAIGSFVKIGPQSASGFRIVSLRLSCCVEPRRATIILK